MLTFSYAFLRVAMIRWRVPELLRVRGWTPYRLAKESGLTLPAAYRLAKGDPVERIEVASLEALCDVFGVEPGELIERLPGRKAQPPRGR
jgi:DNA-binding Xre family transcriptional regulator